jgi:hypothetical protein
MTATTEFFAIDALRQFVNSEFKNFKKLKRLSTFAHYKLKIPSFKIISFSKLFLQMKFESEVETALLRAICPFLCPLENL